MILYFLAVSLYNIIKNRLQFNGVIMQPKNLLTAKNRNELRVWLAENYDRESECWVIVKRGRPQNDNTFWYIDAVEEAMCFGWIDSTTKTLENGITAQKLTRRKKKSLWSELNKERCRRLEKLGLMTEGRTRPFARYVCKRFCNRCRNIDGVKIR